MKRHQTTLHFIESTMLSTSRRPYLSIYFGNYSTLTTFMMFLTRVRVRKSPWCLGPTYKPEDS